MKEFVVIFIVVGIILLYMFIDLPKATLMLGVMGFVYKIANDKKEKM